MTSEIHCDSLWHGADIVTMRDGNYHTLTDGAIAVRDGKIVWIGEHAALPHGLIADETVKFDGGIITPALLTATRTVFGGNRSGEFEQRLNGVSYADIAAQGGGIISTVKATREADEALLLEQALFRLRPLLAEGVTCVEIKSGYGLSPESELKMLRVARKLGELLPVEVKTTCLAAHALPPEYANRADDYINLVCDTIIPQAAAAGPADAVDAFCEHLAFSPAQVERVFAAAEAAGLPVKLHAEQLSALGGSTLAARHHALRRPSRIRHRTRCPRHGRCRHRGGAAARRLLPAARNPVPAGRAVPQAPRGDGDRQRRQPRHLAGAVAAPDDQHGLHAVPPDAGRSVGGRYHPRSQSAGAATQPRHAGNRQGGGLRSLAAVAAGGTGLLVGRPAALYGDFPRRSTSMTIRDPFSFQSGSLPLLISIPHAGTQLTPAVEAGLTDDARPLPDTDWHIPQLYDFARAMGASVLVGNYSRFVIDLNRPADDKPLYTTATTGLYPDVLFDGRPSFLPGKAPTDAERAGYLQQIWQPYHQQLQGRTGTPQCAARLCAAVRRTLHRLGDPRLFDGKLPDLNLGTNGGESCARALSDRLVACCEQQQQYTHVLNGRFKGGYITRAYGQPQQQQHAIQLELAQMNYMSEQYPYAFEPQRAASLQRLLKQMIEGLLDGAAKLN